MALSWGSLIRLFYMASEQTTSRPGRNKYLRTSGGCIWGLPGSQYTTSVHVTVMSQARIRKIRRSKAPKWNNTASGVKPERSSLLKQDTRSAVKASRLHRHVRVCVYLTLTISLQGIHGLGAGGKRRGWSVIGLLARQRAGQLEAGWAAVSSSDA